MEKIRFIFKTEDTAIGIARKGANWNQCCFYVLPLNSRQYEVIKEKPKADCIEVSHLGYVTKIETKKTEA